MQCPHGSNIGRFEGDVGIRVTGHVKIEFTPMGSISIGSVEPERSSRDWPTKAKKRITFGRAQSPAWTVSDRCEKIGGPRMRMSSYVGSNSTI